MCCICTPAQTITHKWRRHHEVLIYSHRLFTWITRGHMVAIHNALHLSFSKAQNWRTDVCVCIQLAETQYVCLSGSQVEQLATTTTPLLHVHIIRQWEWPREISIDPRFPQQRQWCWSVTVKFRHQGTCSWKNIWHVSMQIRTPIPHHSSSDSYFVEMIPQNLQSAKKNLL